jgi:hypothetical protein
MNTPPQKGGKARREPRWTVRKPVSAILCPNRAPAPSADGSWYEIFDIY